MREIDSFFCPLAPGVHRIHRAKAITSVILRRRLHFDGWRATDRSFVRFSPLVVRTLQNVVNEFHDDKSRATADAIFFPDG